MRKFYLGTIVLLLFVFQSPAQLYQWAGTVTATDYTVPTNWTPARNTPLTNDILSFDVAFDVNVTNVPNQTIGALRISSGTGILSLGTNVPGNVLTLSANSPLVYNTPGKILAGQLLTLRLSNTVSFSLATGTLGIEPNKGGKININGPLNLTGGTLEFDVIGGGGATINSSGRITYNSGIFNSLTPAAVTWISGALYTHNVSGASASAIPTSSWNTGSTCTITGMNGGSIVPTGLITGNFSNFTWNCPAQQAAVNLNLSGATMNISGTFTVSATNNQSLVFAGTSGGRIVTNNYTQSGLSSVMLQNAADTTTLSVSGNFSHNGGSLDAVGGTLAGMGVLDLKGAVNKAATWLCSATNSGAQMNIQFTGAAPQSVTIAGLWTPPAAGRCNISITNSVGSGVSLSPGSILQVMNSGSGSAASCKIGGIVTAAASAVSYTGTSVFPTELEYNGTSLQTASTAEFPAASGPTNLRINNSLGVNFPAAFSRDIPGTLRMSLGNLAISTGNTLTLSNTSLASQISYTSGYVTTGTLGRFFPNTGLPTSASPVARYPFGTGENDRSLYVYFSVPISGGNPGIIYVQHVPSPTGTVVTGLSLTDNTVLLDKRTDTRWTTNVGTFTPGTASVSLTAVCGNIGTVDNILPLRLTDGLTANYGTLIPSTGSTAVPVVGKSNLPMSALSTSLYIGSDGLASYNPLIIITFTWTGASNSDWVNAGNWTAPTTVGYPTAQTENAVINTALPNQPNIYAGQTINVFNLTLATGRSLTMAAGSILNVFNDLPDFSGSFNLDPASTFGYAGSGNTQNIKPLSYGNLSVSGLAGKVFPSVVTVRGAYSFSGSTPDVTTNSNTFIYAGLGSQTITHAKYYNLTITGSRGGAIVSLGPTSTPGTIDIANIFNVSGLSNYANPALIPLSNTTVNFSSTAAQTIPGFYYTFISNSGNGPRTLDGSGAVISSRIFNRGTGAYTVIGSKVNFYVTGFSTPTYTTGDHYNDLEISGDLKNRTVDFFAGPIYIAGNFVVSLTNFRQPNNNVTTIVYDGTGDQTIRSYRTDVPSNTPAFKYPNIVIQGAGRNITLAGSDTIIVAGSLQVPKSAVYNADFSYFGRNLLTQPFGAGKGFITGGSTVNFINSAASIPLLIPSVPNSANYHNVGVTSGSRILESDMGFSGNLFVTGTDAAPASLSIGNGASARLLTILGNIEVTGTGSLSAPSGKIDLNSGTNGSTVVRVGGNLLIGGRGHLTGTTSPTNNNGLIVFNNNAITQIYNNSSAFDNGRVNFTIGDGLLATRLQLNSSMKLFGSSDISNRGVLTVTNLSSLDCGTNNIFNGGVVGEESIFNLNAGANFITANTGGVEGPATATNNGSIRNSVVLVKNYDPLASYELNATSTTDMGFPVLPTTPFPMANLIMDNNTNAAFSLNKSIDVSNTLTLKNSVTLAVSDSHLNLKSTSTSTARIAPVPNTANITYGTNGRFVVERYYPGRRAWRLITAPVSVDGSTKSVFDSWQMGGAVTIGSGMYVTGPGANPGSNGLDVSPQNNFSLKLFDGTNLIGVPDTKALKISGNSGTPGVPDNFGMFAFVRGDRSGTSLFNPSVYNNTTLRDTGKVQIKSQVFTLPGAVNSYALVGNPYASPVNITDFLNASTNIDKANIWIWDPNLHIEQGGYVAYTYNGSIWVPSAPSTTFPAGHIQSSQAFFVKKTSVSDGTIPFAETHKSTNNSNGLFRPMAQPAMFRTILNLREANDSNILADGNVVIFDDAFSAGIDDGDAAKFTNIKENLGLLRDTKLLAIERRPTIVADDTLFFRLTKATQRKYQFQFEPTNMDPLLIGFLEDNYTGIKTPVSLTAATIFNFLVNGDAKSAAADRFRIVFKTSGAGPLPVTYSSIKAYQQKENIMIDWTVENEINTDRYEIERSTDGVNYKKINTTNAKGITSTSINYKFLDQNAVDGNNFYRILSYSKSGVVEYSRVLLVKMGKSSGAAITIYPNPVTGNSIGLSFDNMKNGIYQMRLVNTLGQTVMTRQISHTEGNGMETLSPASKLTAGIYQLQVTAPDKSISTIKMIVQ